MAGVHDAGFADHHVPDIPQAHITKVSIKADQLAVRNGSGLPVAAFDPSADEAADVLDLAALILTHRSILRHGFLGVLGLAQFVTELLPCDLFGNPVRTALGFPDGDRQHVIHPAPPAFPPSAFASVP